MQKMWFDEEYDELYVYGNSKIYIQFNRNPVKNNNVEVLKENKRIQLKIARDLMNKSDDTKNL